MQSDTNPLPASEFRRLADAMLACHDKIDEINLRLLSEVGLPFRRTNSDLALSAAAEAYRAARAASPVTLEEYLVREMHEADEAISDAGSQRPDELTKRWNTVAAQLKRHARRLAGEGGA